MKTHITLNGPIKDNETLLTKCLYLPGHVLVNKFDEESAKTFRDSFNKVLEGPQKTIPVVIDSYGGQVYALISMIDTIEAARGQKEIITFTTGKAMSCGAILLSAGDRRYCTENSEVLIHEVSSGTWGKTVEIVNDTDHTSQLNEKMLSYMSVRCGRKPDFISKVIHERGHADWYLSAKDAKRLGLVHVIGTPSINIDISVKVTIK